MPDELDVTFAWGIADGVAGFGVGASGTEADATRYRWTVPEDVFSFSVALWPGYIGHAGPHPGVIAPVVLYNVPTEPGELWLLEPGYPERYSFSVGAVVGASFAGGAGGGGGPIVYGFAGASATVLSKRTGGGDLVVAVLGGEGGMAQGTNPDVWASSPGPTTTGDPVAAPGSGSAGSAGALRGGGGGGGWPGGDGAPDEELAGFSGGNYLPPSTDLGGERSPTLAEAEIDTPVAPTTGDPVRFGALSAWWYADDPTGWIIGAVGFG